MITILTPPSPSHAPAVSPRYSPSSPNLACSAVLCLPRQPDIMALGSAKGLLHDWIWEDNGPQECEGTLWRNSLMLFSPSLTIKRRAGEEEAGGWLMITAENTAMGCGRGMRQRQVVGRSRTWLGGDFVRNWHLWNKTTDRPEAGADANQEHFFSISQFLQSSLIAKFVTRFSICGRSQYPLSQKGGFGPKFTV